jgi:aspartyl-tRNA(Asn)/glutamyl-tRNA(Gln) amidotransferase subunit C
MTKDATARTGATTAASTAASTAATTAATTVIGPETVLHMAKLARLSISEADLPGLAADMRAIVGYFDTLSEADTSQVPETTGSGLLRMPLREDEPVPSLPREEVLAQAPRSFDEGFAVPGFVDE